MVSLKSGIVTELKAKVRDYLQKQGYEITEGTTIAGKSGIEHTFDLLARRDSGFIDYNMAVCITLGGDRENELNSIFSFANETYDAGVRDRVMIAAPRFSQEAKQLAKKQRINVIDGERIEELSALKIAQPIDLKEPFRFETKDKLVKYLNNLGFKVKEKAKIKGRSGVEYTFDILAYSSDNQLNCEVGIDFLSDEKNVDLAQVSLFDTKAYDAGIINKAIIVLPGLSPEARQFARHQQIKVVELGKEAAFERPASLAKSARAEEKLDKKPKLLKQMPQREALQLIPEVMARRYNVIPLAISNNALQVAMADLTDIFALEALSTKSRMRIRPLAATAEDVREAIDFNYKAYGEIEKHISHISIPSEVTDDRLAIAATVDAPLAQALNLIIEEAVKARSSDVHFEPEENRLRIRYRIDGILHDMMSLPLSLHRALISRIKVLADMNIADHFHPQDGQFSFEAKGRDIDIRVACSPSVNGEVAVLRLLDKSMASRGLTDLGLLPEIRAKYASILKVPYGMILVSGPTGAGKTTTLYASINSLDTMGRKIITIEDPAEYRFKDITQIQVSVQAGITFATGLRSILRLDPDVIMVGEIRDAETANIATQAALTGHMMLSSIHAGDAIGVLFRLLDLGVEPFMVASAVIAVVAQRMLRRVCPDCSHLIEAPALEQVAYERETGEKRAEFVYGTGCESCAYTGYQGRTGIFEIMLVSDAIRTMMVSGSSSNEIRTQALKDGMVPMMKDGMLKVKAGITTPSEVLRSAYSPD